MAELLVYFFCQQRAELDRTPEWETKAHGRGAEMGELGIVSAQFGNCFTTLVCEIDLGGYRGKIRGYPNLGKNMVFIGELPVNVVPDQGEGFELLQYDPKNKAQYAFSLPWQKGSDITRIHKTIEALKSRTELFPVKVLSFRQETFVYQRGQDNPRFFAGKPLGEVLSAIWLGTGPAVGEIYGEPFWREGESEIIAKYALVWQSTYKIGKATVLFNCLLTDNGIFHLDFDTINIEINGMNVAGLAQDNNEIMELLIKDFVNGFSKFCPDIKSSRNDRKAMLWLGQVPRMSSKALLEEISRIFGETFKFRL